MKNLLGLFRGGHRPDAETLSAYADGRLSPHDAARLEQHLTECPACTRGLEELSRVRAMLSSMGQVPVPRSFRLRPADVEAQGKAVAHEAAFAGRALRFAPALSLAAVVLFGAVLAADLGTRSDGGGGDMFAASRQGPSEGLTMTEGAAADSAAGGAEGDGEAAAETGAATALSPDESQGVQRDDAYYADTPPAGQAPAPAADATTNSGAGADADVAADADAAEALNASSEGDDGVRAGYLVAEIALAALAIGAIAWIIYTRTRTREVGS